MAISTFTELKTAVADWLNRTDLTATIQNFIVLAEAEFNRRLRSAAMIARADATIDAQYTALPSDFVEMRSLYIKTNPLKKLKFISIEELAQKKAAGYTTSGTPRYFAIVGDTFECLPAPGEDFTAELVYYQKLAALSDANTSNWVLSSHPDVYLYGALMQAAPYLQDDQRISVWGALAEKSVNQLMLADERAEYSGGDLMVRARSY